MAARPVLKPDTAMTSRQLKTYTSLWAMMPHDDSGTILPYDRICERVAGAGYDGMAIDLGAGDVAQAREVRPHMERAGLTPLIVAFPKSIESLRETLIMAKDFGAPFVDVVFRHVLVLPLVVLPYFVCRTQIRVNNRRDVISSVATLPSSRPRRISAPSL